ncbi:MAG: Eco57I restriction-modification methylase domain-containing protein [Candidatus Hodarchaeales archaeon]|jgi:hypothetical protein
MTNEKEIKKIINFFILNCKKLLQTINYREKEPQIILKPRSGLSFENECKKYYNWTTEEYQKRNYTSLMIQIRLIFLFIVNQFEFFPKFKQKTLLEFLIDPKYWYHLENSELQETTYNSYNLYKYILSPLFFNYLVKVTPDHTLGDLKLPFLNKNLFKTSDILEMNNIEFSVSDTVKTISEIGNERSFVSESHPLIDLCNFIKLKIEKYEYSITSDLIGILFEKWSNNQKEQGIYYTPKFIVKFIVEQNLLYHINEITGQLNQFSKIEDLVTSNKLTLNNCEVLLHPQTGLPSLRVLDPAVGSGEFILITLNELVKIYKVIFSKLAKKFDNSTIIRLILSQNLFGVDIDEGAINVCKLRLWLILIEAENVYSKPLPDLHKNIITGNSLVGYTDVTDLSEDEFTEYQNLPLEEKRIFLNDRYKKYLSSWNIDPFHWPVEFSEIMRLGGFDMICLNPPYIRTMNISKEETDYYKKRYYLSKGYVDIYFLFYERAIQLLKTDGIVGIISSNQFLHREHGSKLIEYLINTVHLNLILDIYRSQVFEDITTYTAIVFFHKSLKKPNIENTFPYCQVLTTKDFNNEIMQKIQQNLDVDLSIRKQSWGIPGEFEIRIVNHKQVRTLEKKIEKFLNNRFHQRLGQLANIKSGLTTGLDRIYIGKVVEIQDHKALFLPKGEKELIKAIFLEKELLKPIYFGRDINHWSISHNENVLIFPYFKQNDKFNLYSEDVLQNQFPLVWNYLIKNKKEIGERKRSKTQSYAERDSWYEIPRTRLPAIYDKNGLMAAALTKDAKFCLNTNGSFYVGGTAGVIGIIPKNGLRKDNNFSLFLLAILSSSIYSNYFQNVGVPKRSGYYQLSVNELDKTPIPLKTDFPPENFEHILSLARKILSEENTKLKQPLIDSLNKEIESIVNFKI